MNAKVCPQEDSLGVQVVGDVDDNRRSVHDRDYVVDGDVKTAHALERVFLMRNEKKRAHLFSSGKTARVPFDVIKACSDTERWDPEYNMITAFTMKQKRKKSPIRTDNSFLFNS